MQQPGLRFVAHPNQQAAFVIAIGSSVVAAAPIHLHEVLTSVSSPQSLLDPGVIEPLLPAPAVFVGPAFVGYTEAPAPPIATPSELASSAAPELQALRAAVTLTEWRHANLEAAEPPLAAVLAQGSAICAAGAEQLLGRVAHIGVLTHPAHRGRGLARQVVAAIASQALAGGLLPQFQTLLSNRPALAVARAVGFTQVATTLSARWAAAA